MPKKVLVTGSTRGIGKAIIERFHRGNWDVCISGRNVNQVEDLTNNLNGIRKNSALGMAVDLEVKSELNGLFESIKKPWGELDCIIFNIGSGSGAKGLTSNFAENELSTRINFTNIVKQFNALIDLIKLNNHGGSVIFIGSIAQRINVNAPISYSNSKRALNVFAKYHASTLASRKIRVNIINPGHILTETGVWNKKRIDAPESFNDFIGENIPIGSIGKVEEIAEAVFFCADGLNQNFLVGASIDVDGGTSLN
jgi:NAD(P)-dependent dehydrogenase (short-subunit alcohol dehydrogenase family)